MLLHSNTAQRTGYPFIDNSHPIIAAYVNAICDELSRGKSPRHILSLVKNLQNHMETYLIGKKACQDKCGCLSYSHSLSARDQLDDIYLYFSKIEAISQEDAIERIRFWAKQAVFNVDQPCFSCMERH